MQVQREREKIKESDRQNQKKIDSRYRVNYGSFVTLFRKKSQKRSTRAQGATHAYTCMRAYTHICVGVCGYTRVPSLRVILQQRPIDRAANFGCSHTRISLPVNKTNIITSSLKIHPPTRPPSLQRPEMSIRRDSLFRVFSGSTLSWPSSKHRLIYDETKNLMSYEIRIQ